MPLISRISRLVTADAHALLDSLEEPEVMLAAALRDMENAIAGDRSCVAALQRQQADLTKRQLLLTTQLRDIDSQLDLVIDEDNSSLARELVRRKLNATRQANELRQRGEANQQQIEQLQTRLVERQARLDQIQHELQLLRPIDAGEASGSAATVSDADIEIALLQERKARRQS